MNPKVIASIARKDVVDAIRHRYLLIALLTPLLVALLFRFLLPLEGAGLSAVKLIVHDAGRSELVSALRRVPQLNLIEVTANDVSNEFEKQKALAALEIPPNFDADVLAGKQPELTIYFNPRRSNLEQSALQRLLDQQLYILAKQPIPAKLVWIDLTKQFAAPEARELNFNQTLLLLLIVMALAITGGLVVPLLVVEEKEKRTLDFLLISPAKLTDLIAGKALAGLTYAFLIVAVLLAFNRNVVGKRLPVLITIMFGAVLFVSMGLLIGSLFHSSMQVNTWGGFILFVLLMPAFGLSDLPVAIKSAMPFIPTYYFVDALKLSLGGAKLLGILKGLAMTSFTCALAFSAATWILRRFVN